MAEKKKYGVYTEDVEFKDRLQVPNFCEIKLYNTRKFAQRKASKKDKDKVYPITKSEYRRKCPRKVEEIFEKR